MAAGIGIGQYKAAEEALDLAQKDDFSYLAKLVPGPKAASVNGCTAAVYGSVAAVYGRVAPINVPR